MIDRNEPAPEEIPPHYSGVRYLSALGDGTSYKAFVTLEEARREPDTAAIMEGDCGGQIYFTCPVAKIACAEDVLHRLLADLDSLSWGDGELYYEVLPVMSGVWGGMGGAAVIDGVWLHEEFELLGLRNEVEAVTFGRLEGITQSVLHEGRERQLAFLASERGADQVQATWSFLAENDWKCTHCGVNGRAETGFRLHIHPRNRARQFILCWHCDWPQHLRPQWQTDGSHFDEFCPKCGKPLHSIRARQCTQCGAHWFNGVRPSSDINPGIGKGDT